MESTLAEAIVASSEDGKFIRESLSVSEGDWLSEDD
jgi:hypothetical protein